MSAPILLILRVLRILRVLPRFRPLRPRPAPPLPATLALAMAVHLLAAPAPTAAQPAPLAGLDAYVERAMTAWEVPGLALAVVRGDSVLHARGYGVTRLGDSEAVDEHTLFAIASTTKAFTSAALASLVDEGRLAWDDPVTRHLPGFALADAFVSREFTVRDLLTHRVGAARLDNLWIASPFDRAEILRRARHLPQVEGFRETYGYNNILYIAAGEVAAAAAGVSWDEMLEQRFFGPLGMERSTSRAAVVEARGNTAHSHTRIEGDVHAIPRRDYDAIGGAGAIWSSAHDMARWIRLHLGRGAFEGERLLAEARFAEMYAPHTAMGIDSTSARMHPSNHFAAYALGWRVQDLHGRKVVQHSGSINYTRTQVTLVPDEGIGVVAMANLSSSNLQLALTHWILDALQGREPEDWSTAYLELALRSDSASARSAAELESARLPDVGPSLPLEGYAGRYDDALFGGMRILREEGDAGAGLVLHYSPEYVADLEPWHQDIFRATWRRPGAGRTFVRFTLDTRGRVTEAVVEGYATFRRVGDSPPE
jgi:CubicO group peptidase (beta-lactamase class C family)